LIGHPVILSEVVRRLIAIPVVALLAVAAAQMPDAREAIRLGRTQDETLFASFSKRLGRLQAYGGSQREGYFFKLTMRGRVLTYVYLVTARFERGPAQIRVRAVWRDGEWKLSDFYVLSEALALR